MSDSSDSKEKAEQAKQSALAALEHSSRFTPEEQENIASTIQTEIAKLLPQLPEGIAEITAKAVELAMDATEKLIDLQERPTTSEKSGS
ncbi:MAG: hypothetical protein SXV54_04405 [Chloroflexota bacterium]|nr:hypothetical protein [Chloroflexota bacterium]